MKAINLKAIIFLLSISTFLVSCEDIVELKLSDKDIGLYAVEAKITTNNNPFVLLYKSQLVSSDADYPGVSGATVVIADNSTPQKSITLQESNERKGLYIPMKDTFFLGVKGREYNLTITVDGVTMLATEMLAPVEPIDSIQVRPSNRGDKLFLGIFTYGNEPAGLGNYYKWDIYVNKRLLASSKYLIIANDEIVDGNYISGLEIFTDFHDPKKPEDMILNLGDTIQVNQTSVSKFGYNFYSQMSNQGQTGGLFSVPPANIKSNITSSDNRHVLGMFTANDVSASNTVIIDEKILSGLKK
ncbi:MAG: DUF4249 family protein [Candidatus Saccharimonadaceae bacterium]